MNIRWTVAPRDNQIRAAFSEHLAVPELIAQIIANRNIVNLFEAKEFLNPSWKGLHDPYLMHDMEKAADRIIAAIAAGEKIVIYGDYDVDGITGTVTLMQALKMYGATVDFYIPHRTEEGYGLHDESIGKIIDEGAKLIISVDCGVTAIGPAKVAKQRGIDLIISDHHEFHSDNLPDAYALVHPRLGEPSYPNPHICGSGVAFKLAWAVGKKKNDNTKVSADCAPFFKSAMAFTALGTIADVVPLIGENRVIAQFGLKQLHNSVFDGLRALVASAHLDGKDIDGYKVGFTLAPRLNAAGRMGHASSAVNMLSSNNYTTALVTGEKLEKENQDRQKKERQMVKEADEQYQKLLTTAEPTDVIIVQDDYPPSVGPRWHKGVMGIVASRLSDKYHKPSIVFVGDGASGRSVEGFSLIHAVRSCDDLLEHYGGHEAACGLHLRHGKLNEFRRRVCEYARAHQTPEMQSPEIKIECEATLDEMTEDFTTQLQKLGPFGNGNRRPFFVFRNVTVKEARPIGKEGQYLMFIGEQGARNMKFVWFKPTTQSLGLAAGEVLDIVAEPTLNEFKGKTSVELLVKDLRSAEEKSYNTLAFSPT